MQWEKGRDKLVHAATALLNYDLPLDLASAGLLAAFLLGAAALRLVRAPPRALIALGATGLLFAVAPLAYKGTGYVDARFAVMVGLLLFAGLRPDRLSARAGRFVAVAVAAVFGIRTAEVAANWHAHARDIAQLRDAIALVEPGSRVLLAVVGEDEVDPARRAQLRRQYLSDGTRLDSHTAALVLIERHSFWTFLFAQPSQQPIELRPAYLDIAEGTLGMPDLRMLAAPRPVAADLARFPLEGKWWCCYDYALVLEAGAGPDIAGGTLELLRKTDYASLYQPRRAGPAALVGR
jgi:hypothetical protein